MITVGELKKLLENIDNDVIVLSSEEGYAYELEDKDIDFEPFEYVTYDNKIAQAISIG